MLMLLNIAYILIRKIFILIRILARKIYVYCILSVRYKWYISKNNNYYNPTLEATVYKWASDWNIARFSVHYDGYKTKKLAQEVAFKMWMKERLKKKNPLKLHSIVHNAPLQKILTITQQINEQSIKFVIKDGWFITRIDDTELRFIYDSNQWTLSWERYEVTTECVAEWWCHSKNYSLDLVDLAKADPKDELCYECLRIKTEIIIESASAADKWINSPSNLEEVRLSILKEYKKLSHNGLNNTNLFKIMHSKWIHRS